MNPQTTPPGPQMTPPTTPPDPETASERIRLTGHDVMPRIQQLVHEGSVRRVVVKHPDGHTIVEFPLLVGVVGAALIPVWAALGAIVALVADCTIEVEKVSS